MNRQEAYKFLADYVDRNYDPDCDYDKFCEAMRCVNTLAPPTPDPITGLVPCGCGGVAISEDYFGDDDVESSYRAFVSCGNCELRTPDYPRLFDAKEAWNTAMGWKGGAEKDD